MKIRELNDIISNLKNATEGDDDAMQKLDRLSELVGSVDSSTATLTQANNGEGQTEAAEAWFFAHTFQPDSKTDLKRAMSDMCALCFACHLNDVYDKKTFRGNVIKFVESKFSTTDESLREAFVERICHARWQVLERDVGIVDRRRRVRPRPHSAKR